MTTLTFEMPAATLPVAAEPDVCVLGGGVAGVAAAVAAARLGLGVVLVEKYGFCGGATVAGLSGTLCGLFSSGRRPEQIVFGFAGEFYQHLCRRGGAHAPVKFGRTLLVPHDSFIYKLLADDYLSEAGVKVLFHSNFVRAYADESGRVHTLVLRTPEGLSAVRPGYVIDASGDAEVVNSLGGATHLGREGTVQTPTMVFRMGHVDMPRFLALDPAEIVAWVTEADEAGAYRLPRHHVYLFPLPNSHEVLCNMTRITLPDGRAPLGITAAGLTYAEIEGRRQAQEYARFLRDRVPGFGDAYLADTGAQVGIRQTRSIAGQRTLLNSDVLRGRKVAGAATRSAWPIEAHGAGQLKIVYLEDDYYDIPFETLIPHAGTNLLVAGRCLSAEHEALASARVTAQCFGLGYAAGAACGLLSAERLSSQAVSGTAVADWMRANGLRTAEEA